MVWQSRLVFVIYVVLQILGGLAVETAYPLVGLYRMQKSWVRENQHTLRKLGENRSFLIVDGENLLAGSRAEGLVMDEHWGHGKADEDDMYLRGGDLAVYVLPPGQQPPENATLVYTPQNCLPAYIASRLSTRIGYLAPS